MNARADPRYELPGPAAAEAHHATLRSAFMSSLALELITTISVALIAVLTVGVRLVNGTLGLDTAILVLLLAPRVLPAAARVGAAFHQSEDGVAAPA